jgi:MazG family protein
MSIHQKGENFVELVAVMQRLLAPDGCPWDREQTLETLKPFAVEEVYEVLEAIEDGDVPGHCDELGDLLLQIVFQAELRAATDQFGIDDVVRAIVSKLVRRHPHVFGETRVQGANEVLANWKKLKEAEHADKGKRRGPLDGVPRGIPALLQAQRIGEKAADVGFDWPDVRGVREKLDEELAELDRAVAQKDRAAITEEIGDVLFTLTRLAAKLQVAPEDALRACIDRFRARFAVMQDKAAQAGHPENLAGLSLDEMDQLWRLAKQELQAKKNP